MNASNTTASAAERAQDAVNNERLQSAIAALAAFGGRDDGGVSRETLTPIDLAARRHLIDYARSLGCEVGIDDCANLFFRRAGTSDRTPVLTGSHADTQPVGGKLDGAYGVLAGLEVIAALNDAGIRTVRPIEVVAWTNEEGSRFGPGTMGSSAFVTPSLLDGYRQSVDKDGIVMGDALDAALKEVPDVPRRAMALPMEAYVELHIEQGPVLERANAALGVVTGIQSVRWYRVVCTGMAAHAGTTPMDERSDAMAAAMAIATQLYARADQEAAHNIRLTLGRWHVGPNSINTIPGEVEFTIDVRCVDAAVLDRFERFLQDVTSQHAWRGNITFENLFYRAPTAFPQPMLDLIEKACTRASDLAQRGAPKKVTSGAFHDAMYMADHCPTGMIFVPSKDGISHNAAEETAPADLYLGVQALAYTMVELANR
ncbi:MAG: M20 family metallo-hydrolase [Oxalicibacterium faecigallinarum]|uniref:Zn-dependent hydrolase n=1 Tax=Oxalicibacterium faecigallinarum TaxID=573741 RepID=A0A8J3ARA5_9BURK|nr:M20 family metallo-hydrolase [Oxalicibacterium faecigallinarum]MDQ7969758.1 M20 family metallo-hydrolase [Oxalicibacterium faecigallinarum]GGI20546.1 Zn-dependent hydrolase [Oxalicibacterium faecigallinarum]